MLENILTNYLEIIAYAVGYDISDQTASNYISLLVGAGVNFMLEAGVKEKVIEDNSLVIATLIIFVTDNLNMNAGRFMTSPMFVFNVEQLRYTEVEVEDNEG